MTEFEEIRRLLDKIETNEDDLNTQISEKDQRIDALEAEISDLKDTISNLEGELFGGEPIRD